VCVCVEGRKENICGEVQNYVRGLLKGPSTFSKGGGGRERGRKGRRAAMCFTLTDDMEEERRLVAAASLGFLWEWVGVAASGAATAVAVVVSL